MPRRTLPAPVPAPCPHRSRNTARRTPRPGSATGLQPHLLPADPYGVPSDAGSTSTREALPAGSPQRWVIRSGHRVRSWRTLITVILLNIMGSAAGAFTLALEHSALAAIESETDLHQVASELHRIDALEWRLSAGSATPDVVRVRLAASSAVIEHLLADAAAEQLHPTETESLRRDFALYRDALEREIRFIEHGVDHPSHSSNNSGQQSLQRHTDDDA